jgi:serine/threonine protein phosphatase PrpC
MERSGSTAVVVILTPSHIVCANVGDSRAILRRASTVIPLSFDHKPSNLPERIRVEQAGGFVKGKRIDGDLAVSRAFGDFVHKDNITLSCAKQKVISVPDISICPRDKKHDEFIIIACDGIWDVFSNDEISNFVHNAMATSPSPKDLATICESTIDESFHQRRSRDNMTFMIIGFNNAIQSIATHSASSFFPFQSFTGGFYTNTNKSTENATSSNDDKLPSSWLQSISSPFDGENKRLLTWF